MKEEGFILNKFKKKKTEKLKFNLSKRGFYKNNAFINSFWCYSQSFN